MKITNQKPVILSPVYTDNIAHDFDARKIAKDIFGTPLFTPVIPSQPVTMTANRNAITDDSIADIILQCCTSVFDPVAEQTAKTIFGQTLVTYNDKTNLTINEIFPVQSGKAAGLPEPNDVTVYTPSMDVIPNARKFLAGQTDYNTFFASLAYFARPTTLGFYFANEVAFDEFKVWVASQMTMLGNVLPPDVTQLAADFQNTLLNGLTESLILRINDGDSCEPNSFARLIVHLLMNYVKVVSQAEFGVLPFNIGELISPKTVVFVNVEQHSRATARQVASEWKLINDSIKTKPTMLSNSKLRKLTAAQRSITRIAANAANAALNQMAQNSRSGNIRFSSKQPATIDVARLIKRLIDKMAFVNKSMNIYKRTKASFARPNRRDPDDFNKQGKMVSTQYKPDLHLYIDTSGSISERDYEDAVKACIAMAKALNINMYFNSFSHIMSQTTRLRTQDKSRSEIYREFQRVPKVDGGTDFEQIWHFINSSKQRTREISVMITDFGYTASSHFVKHPKNIYYIPCSNQNWKTITSYAEGFCKSMLHNDPGVRQHILF